LQIPCFRAFGESLEENFKKVFQIGVQTFSPNRFHLYFHELFVSYIVKPLSVAKYTKNFLPKIMHPAQKLFIVPIFLTPRLKNNVTYPYQKTHAEKRGLFYLS
jgi:hypothetical protein